MSADHPVSSLPPPVGPSAPPPPPPPPVPTSPASVARIPRAAARVSRLWWLIGPLSLALTVAMVVLLVRPVPYVVFRPGSAQAVEPLTKITAKPGQPKPFIEAADDDILFVTVSVLYPTGVQALVEANDDYTELAPKKLYLGTQSEKQNQAYNLSLMTDAKDKAAYVALTSLGYEVKVTNVGAVLVDVDPSFPSAKVLQPGDTVVSVNGASIKTQDDLVAAIGKQRPGDKITVGLQRLGSDKVIEVVAPLIENKAKPGRPQLGVNLGTRPSFEFPVDITIDSGKVGGPSAGLAFTLALMDRLSSGDLTGGRKVAVTGTIELDSTVGPVGGVRQKTRAAIAAGATTFLVPPEEYSEAVHSAKGELKVISVSTVQEALKALQSIGGDPVKTVSGAAVGAGGN